MINFQQVKVLFNLRYVNMAKWFTGLTKFNEENDIEKIMQGEIITITKYDIQIILQLILWALV